MSSPRFVIIWRLIKLDEFSKPTLNDMYEVLTAMRQLFSDLPEAIENTLLVSQRLDFQLNDLGYEFPCFETPNGEPVEVFLRKRVAEGIERRYMQKCDSNLRVRAKNQAESELELIHKLGFAGYFPHSLGHCSFLQR